MNKSAIKMMYYGEKGTFDSLKNTPEIKHLLNEINYNEEMLLQKLKKIPEIISQYNKLQDLLSKLNCAESELYYIEGFRFGVLLGLDVADLLKEE